MDACKFPDGIWLIDFEFHAKGGREGNAPEPVCLVAREWPSGLTRRVWGDDLRGLTCAPFPTGKGALCVAYFASAEMDCFLVLGWPLPTHLLDLFTEFR
jgi:DNA polymerase-1